MPPPFRVFKGPWPEISKKLGKLLVNVVNTPSDNVNLQNETNRFTYISFRNTFKTIKKRLDDFLQSRPKQYTQGLFDGSLVPEIHLAYYQAAELQKLSEIFSQLTQDQKNQFIKDRRKTPPSSRLSFPYEDDDGNISSCTITYCRDDSDLSKPLKDRPHRFMMEIFSDIEGDCRCTYITHEQFLSALEGHNGEENLETNAVKREIRKALKSESVYQLIEPVINGENIDPTKFKELNERLLANRDNPDKSLDERDTKLDKLGDLLVFWAQLANNPESASNPNIKRIMDEMIEIINNAYQDPDYFKNRSQTDIDKIVDQAQHTLPQISPEQFVQTKQQLMQITQIYTQTINRLNTALTPLGFTNAEQVHTKINQHFINRNKGSLLLIGATTLLAAAGIALVLSPIGLGLAATGIAIAAAIGIVGGIIAAVAGRKMGTNEKKLSQAQGLVAKAENTQLDPNKTQGEQPKQIANSFKQKYHETLKEKLKEPGSNIEMQSPKKISPLE